MARTKTLSFNAAQIFIPRRAAFHVKDMRPLLNLRFFIETGMEMSQPCTPKCLRVVRGTRAFAVGNSPCHLVSSSGYPLPALHEYRLSCPWEGTILGLVFIIV